MPRLWPHGRGDQRQRLPDLRGAATVSAFLDGRVNGVTLLLLAVACILIILLDRTNGD